ncbi:MAG TPA: sigma factor G inhibitor Gin [Limnochordia bacterium]|nr:sigma factor G inhibitor Gin [Limnochordia bacterium]
MTVATLPCFFCGQEAPDGLAIAHIAICGLCHERLVRSCPGDPDYDVWVRRLRAFWQGLAEAAISQD